MIKLNVIDFRSVTKLKANDTTKQNWMIQTH